MLPLLPVSSLFAPGNVVSAIGIVTVSPAVSTTLPAGALIAALAFKRTVDQVNAVAKCVQHNAIADRKQVNMHAIRAVWRGGTGKGANLIAAKHIRLLQCDTGAQFAAVWTAALVERGGGMKRIVVFQHDRDIRLSIFIYRPTLRRLAWQSFRWRVNWRKDSFAVGVSFR